MIEVIPAGASAVVTDKREGDHIKLMEAIKDSEADLERSGGQHFGNTLSNIKDAESNIRFAVKDAEANLERSHGQFAYNLKEVESDLERSSGTRFGETLKTVKEAECAVEKAKCQVIEAVKDASCCVEKSECRTRELMQHGFKELSLQDCRDVGIMKDAINDARKELESYVIEGFKENLLESKNIQNLANKLAMNAERTACANQTQTLLQFKDQAMLSEKLAFAASKENAEHFCQVKELVRAENAQTRCLIESFERDRLRERAAKAEAALNSYFSRGVPPTAPVGI